MMPQSVGNMFRFTYTKTAEEIVSAATVKIGALRAKIAEREQRLRALREEYGITDAVLAQLLVQARRQAGAQTFTYSSPDPNTNAQMEERTIGAGVVNNLLTESDFIESESEAVRSLALIVRNLRPVFANAVDGTPYTINSFKLSAEELVYLGF